jgi:hypothetical protein
MLLGGVHTAQQHYGEDHFAGIDGSLQPQSCGIAGAMNCCHRERLLSFERMSSCAVCRAKIGPRSRRSCSARLPDLYADCVLFFHGG